MTLEDNLRCLIENLMQKNLNLMKMEMKKIKVQGKLQKKKLSTLVQERRTSKSANKSYC
jgi:hypothetical protein